MTNFKLRFIAKIQGVWVPVEGEVAEQQGWRYLLCKHNGYPYYLSEGYRHFPDDVSEEALREQAIRFNTAEFDKRIQAEKAQAEANNRWNRPGGLRAPWGEILAGRESPASEALREALNEARAARRRPMRRR